jgi:hypothetical protein
MAFLSAISRAGAIWRIGLALLTATPAWAAPAAAAPSEYQIKAVFLFNFAQFVEWPASVFADAKAPLVIGVLGDDPFGPVLDEAVRGEKIDGHPLVVRRYRRADDIADCHLLFISRTESVQHERILARLKSRSLLTVGDTDAFNRHGGMVRFVTESNKVRFKINVQAARAAGLVISSKLLRPAMVYDPASDQP